MNNSATVLLVEDNEMEQVLAHRAISKADVSCKILCAFDGAEACDMLLSPTGVMPKLVLLDLGLPKLNGFEVLQRIRANEHSQHVPVVLLSASADDADVAKAYALGANSFVRKTIDNDIYESLLRLVVYYWIGVNEPVKSGAIAKLGEAAQAGWAPVL